ncbi:MAG TPA: hypothetical protein VEQ18_04645, partial [Candidatus Nitrosocosmicus sp.]|nr:hypothetical protein [Candidatus Nitrosocosmicus sp.]
DRGPFYGPHYRAGPGLSSSLSPMSNKDQSSSSTSDNNMVFLFCFQKTIGTLVMYPLLKSTSLSSTTFNIHYA